MLEEKLGEIKMRTRELEQRQKNKNIYLEQRGEKEFIHPQSFTCHSVQYDP